MLEMLITVIRIEVQALKCSHIHILYETLFHIHCVIDVFSHYFCFFVDYSEVLLIFKAFLTYLADNIAIKINTIVVLIIT